jgi:hypothetical protein
MQEENLQSDIPSAERQSFLRLTRELAGLPLDKSAAAIETSAAIQFCFNCALARSRCRRQSLSKR